MFSVEASAPSNIALIKYMGKVAKEAGSGENSNQPTNSSLSFTLEDLRTTVRITESSGGSDSFSALDRNLVISEKGMRRFLRHFEFLKKSLGIEGCFLVQSTNNFPSDCGLASSASSFAALTLAASELAKAKAPAASSMSLQDLSSLSRQGSGSSCRSLFGPFSVWKSSFAEPVHMNFCKLEHLAVLASEDHKAVSSSEAHLRVTTSLLFEGRPQRAEKRLHQLLNADREKNWSAMFEIVWAEFWDMHALFETSSPTFGYMNASSLEILEYARRFWMKNHDGPLVTMDAGPNVHLLFRQDQVEARTTFVNDLSKKHRIWTSAGGPR